MTKKIGILALQGGYAAHATMCKRLNLSWCFVYTPEDLQAIDGLIIPGGESTTLIKLMKSNGLDQTIQSFAQSGKAIFGTCAGSILLGQCAIDEEHDALQLMDMSLERNAYGRQIDSFIAEGQLEHNLFAQHAQEMIFIRAPQITHYTSAVQPLAWCRDRVVMVQQDHCIAATFHPELSTHTQIHAYFVAMI